MASGAHDGAAGEGSGDAKVAPVGEFAPPPDISRRSAEGLGDVVKRMMAELEIKDRRYHLTTYKSCFVASDAVAWMLKAGVVSTRDDAMRLGNALISAGILHHVTDDHHFEDSYLFFRFFAHETDKQRAAHHGKVAGKADGSAHSWAELTGLPDASRRPSLMPLARGGSVVLGREPPSPTRPAAHAAVAAAASTVAAAASAASDSTPAAMGSEAGAAIAGFTPTLTEPVFPMDEHNVALLDAVHPPKWVDPVPEGSYNMVVIGAGAGGLVTAAACKGVGARVAIIEENLMGGDCLNVGCVPSKALIRAAKAAAAVRDAHEFGIHVPEGKVRVDFGAIMRRMRKLRAQIAPNDSAQRFAETLGVDVYIGRARFTGKSSISVNGKSLQFSKATVATGGKPRLPTIPSGWEGVDYLTNATLFNLTTLPKRFGVIGGGPIGAEMAQSFARFGSEVTVLTTSFLGREDPEAVALVKAAFDKDGVKVVAGVKITGATQGAIVAPAAAGGDDGGAAAASTASGATASGAGSGTGSSADEAAAEAPFRPHGPITITADVPTDDASGGTVSKTFVFDEVLIATGRIPNVTNMGLEAAGVDFDESTGVIVNDKLQSVSNANVFAVGDVCSPFKFTHAADWMARMVVRNALFFGGAKFSQLLIPWCTYTEPEVAHVGLYGADLEEQGIEYDEYTKSFEHVDRAILDGETDGFVKVFTRKGADTIVGATIVARDAGSLISEITLAMQSGTGLGKLGKVIHSYPTQADAIRGLGDMYNRTRMTPTVKTLFGGLMRAQR